MSNIKLRAKAVVRIAWPVAWPEGVGPVDRFRVLWHAIGEAVQTSEHGRRFVERIDFTFSNITLYVLVPCDWTDERATEVFYAIGADAYQRCGVVVDDDRARRIQWELTRQREPFGITIDADAFRREEETYQGERAARLHRENGSSAGAVEG